MRHDAERRCRDAVVGGTCERMQKVPPSMPYQFGSPRFKLWLADAGPILKRGAFAALAAFLAQGVAPLVGVTAEHSAAFAAVAGLVGLGVQAAIEFVKDKSKG